MTFAWLADPRAGVRLGSGVSAVAEDPLGPHDALLWYYSSGFCGQPHHQSAAAALQPSAPHAGSYCPGQTPLCP